MKTDLFQSCGHCWVFQIRWHIEFNSLTASSFRIWNSSAGIPSFPLALLLVMLLKVHLTLHPRMSASRWVTTLSWLSGSLRSFLYSYFGYSCSSLLKIFCFCQVHTISVLYRAHLCMKCPLVSLIFLMRALVVPIPLFSSISLHFSFLAILWNSAFRWVYLSFFPLPFPLPFVSLLFSAIHKPPQAAILPCCTSFAWVWFWSLPLLQCYGRLSACRGNKDFHGKHQRWLWWTWITFQTQKN